MADVSRVQPIAEYEAYPAALVAAPAAQVESSDEGYAAIADAAVLHASTMDEEMEPEDEDEDDGGGDETVTTVDPPGGDVPRTPPQLVP
jgi:hypothetical protein